MLYEAYGHRGAFGEDLVHLVDWAYPQTAGPGRGAELEPVKLEHIGHADGIGADLCSLCALALERVPRVNGHGPEKPAPAGRRRPNGPTRG